MKKYTMFIHPEDRLNQYAPEPSYLPTGELAQIKSQQLSIETLSKAAGFIGFPLQVFVKGQVLFMPKNVTDFGFLVDLNSERVCRFLLSPVGTSAS